MSGTTGITGRQVRDESLTGDDIQDGSVLRTDLSAAVQTELNQTAIDLEELTKLTGIKTRSIKPTYSGHLIDTETAYSSTTQVVGNRLSLATYTYTSDRLDSAVINFYESDGTTIYMTFNVSYSYDVNDNLINIEVT